MLPPPGELPKTGAVIEHVYQQQGIYTARVTVSAGDEQATAEVTITVGGGGLPPPPGGPSDNDADAFEGFGSTTPGGAGGRIIAVTQATEDGVRDAFTAAGDGHAIIRFDTVEPIAITQLAAAPHRQLHHGRGQRRDAVRAERRDSPT